MGAFQASDLLTKISDLILICDVECYFALKVWNAQNIDVSDVLVADDRDEPLITMDSPKEDMTVADYLDKISVPSTLIEKSFGDDLKKAMQNDESIKINLDWDESMPHPSECVEYEFWTNNNDERVEYEFWTNNNDERVEYESWTNSNDECGPRCDDQMDFVRNFKGHAQILENSRVNLIWSFNDLQYLRL